MTLKYLDPSYSVRATPASAEDAVFCDALARNAAQEKRVPPGGDLWRDVVSATGQPSFMP